MKQKHKILTVLLLLVTIELLLGCSKKEKSQNENHKAIVPQIPVASREDKKKAVLITKKPDENKLARIDCNGHEPLQPAQQLWCMGEKAWESGNYTLYSYISQRKGTFKAVFIKAYEQGMIDAQQARNVDVSSMLKGLHGKDNRVKKIVSDAYKQGYQSVMSALGIVSYICFTGQGKKQTELHKHWCNAKKHYDRIKATSENNPVLEERFIAGYLSGQALALTLPSSMDSVFQNDKHHHVTTLHTIGTLPHDAPAAEKLYYNGLKEGFATMLKKIKQSVEQVIQQLHLPDNHEENMQ